MNEPESEAPLQRARKPRRIGVIGSIVGAVALGIALFHFFFGPLEQPPSVEDLVAETAVNLKNAFDAKLQGKTYEPATTPSRLDADELLRRSVIVLGFIAIVLAAVGFVQHEDWRASTVAIVLGAGAIVFQFTVLVLGAILALLLIFIVLNALGLG